MGFTPVEEDAQPVSDGTGSSKDAAPEQTDAPATKTAEPKFEIPVMTATPVQPEEVDTLITAPLKGENWDFKLPDSDTQKEIQETLRALNIYPGSNNGMWGDISVASIEQSLSLQATSVPSFELCKAVLEAGGSKVEGEAILDQAAWDAYAKNLQGRN